MFRVGQKVVCIRDWRESVKDDRLRPGNGYADELPEVGCIYTVREVLLGNSGHECIRLIELRNPIRMFSEGVGEVRFRSHGFRPIVERKTDISIFKAMLTPAGRKLRVEA